MVSNNRRRSLRMASRRLSEDSTNENPTTILSPTESTGDSISANPPSLPEIPLSTSFTNQPPTLAPSLERDNPSQIFSQPTGPTVFHLPENQEEIPFASRDREDSNSLTSPHVPVMSADVLSVLPVIPAAVLPATPVQTGLLLSTTLDSNVMNSNVQNSNVQSVTTSATISGATNDVVGSNFIARYLLPHEKVRKLSKVPTHFEVLSITNDLRKVGCPFTFVDVVPLDVEQNLVTLLQRGYCVDRAKRDDCEGWKFWTTEKFCDELLKAVPDKSIDTPLGQASFLEQVSSFDFRFDLNKIETDTQNDTALANLVANFPSTTAEDQLRAVKILERQLPTQPVNWQLILRRKVNGETVPINDLKDFRIVWWTQLTTLRNSANELRAAGFEVTPGPATRSRDKPISKRAAEPDEDTIKPRAKSAKTAKSSNPSTTRTLQVCVGCGRPNHTIYVCRFTASPYFNSSDSAYADSIAFKKLKKDYPDAMVARGVYVPTTSSSSSSSTATASASAVPEGSSKPVTKQKSLKKTSKFKSNVSSTDFVIPNSILGILTNPSSADFLTATVSHVSQISQPRNKVQVLIDTGALAGNFVAMRVIKNFHLEDFIINSNTLTVCSALNNKCYNISKSILLNLTYFSERLNKNTFLKIQAIILNDSPVDLVIGRQTIRESNIFLELPSQLTSTNLVPRAATLATPQKVIRSGVLASLVLKSEKLSQLAVPNDDEIGEHEANTFLPWLPDNSIPKPVDPISLINISGTPELQEMIKQLCTEYKDIFSNTLSSQPAAISPFDLVVDNTK